MEALLNSDKEQKNKIKIKERPSPTNESRQHIVTLKKKKIKEPLALLLPGPNPRNGITLYIATKRCPPACLLQRVC